MAKVIDITDKLNYDDSPKIRIGDQELEVKSDAATVLKIMGVASSKETGVKEVLTMYELLFDTKEREKIESLNLNFQSFRVLIEEAMKCVTGDDDTGEAVTRTMI